MAKTNDLQQSHPESFFCLNGTNKFSTNPLQSHCPTSEYISLAEKHLKLAPLDLVNDILTYVLMYNIAMSDLHRCKGDKQQSREYAEKAKSLCTENLCAWVEVIDDRLELLRPDAVDELLEKFKRY